MLLSMSRCSSQRSALAAWAVAVFTILSAVGANAEGSGPSERLPTPSTVKAVAGADFHLYGLAHDLGIFDKYNIKLEETRATVGGIALVPIIVSGEADTSDPGVTAPIIARSKGAKVTAVAASYSTGGDFDTVRYFARSDSDIKSAKDLEGRRVAVANVGATPDIILTVWLNKNGAASDKVQRIAIPYANQIDALLNNQVDAIGVIGVIYSALEKSPDAQKLRLLFRDRDGLPSDKMLAAYFFTDEFIAKKPEVIRAFVSALKETLGWVRDNPAEARAMIAKHYDLKPENVVTPQWPANLCLDATAAAEWVAALQSVGQVKSDSELESPTSWMTNQFNPDCRQ